MLGQLDLYAAVAGLDSDRHSPIFRHAIERKPYMAPTTRRRLGKISSQPGTSGLDEAVTPSVELTARMARPSI
jgi:hypothetical protein